jgi:regulatory protein
MAGYQRDKKERPPMDTRRLRDLALHYVGRYATSKARLVRYLSRKIGEVGWAEDTPPADLQALAMEFEELGYISDSNYAQMRAHGLASRGYGHRRIEQDLRANGIDGSMRAALLRIGDDAADCDDFDTETLEAVDRKAAAITFARRKRIGPFAQCVADPDLRRKQTAQMLRAGHDFDIVRKLVDAEPGNVPEF